MDSNIDNTKVKTAIGCLLLGADEISKRVITAFEPFAKRAQNIKALNSFNLDMLEACAQYLDIVLADSSDHKIFTKESLINRIILGLHSFLPSHCSECNECYTVSVSDDQKPLFYCFMCFQGSHDCDPVKSKHESLNVDGVGLLSGHVWLCNECLKSSNPVKPRKSKTRHNSSTKTDPSLSRIQEELQGDIFSPDNQSPTPLTATGLVTPVHESDQHESALSDANRAELQERLSALSKKRACSKYKVGKCPHGLKGNKKVNGEKCEFEHPKKCHRFCSFGKTARGCKKGDNCEYFHPVLCKFSVQKRLCENKDCTYMHLKGTKRSKTTQNAESRQRRDTENRQSDPPKNPPSSSTGNHFLELKNMVEMMQANFLQEIASIKANLQVQQPSVPFVPQFSPSMMMHQPQPSVPYQPPQRQMTFIPQSLC